MTYAEYQTVPGLQFDEDSHTYAVNGVPVPSVTQVLQDVGIIDYSAIPDGARAWALERGRFVHQVCQFSDDGDLGEVDPTLQGYLDAWLLFRSQTGFVPDLIEYRGHNPTYGFAGTLDRRGCFPGQSATLLDIKTSVAPAWTAYQTAAYASFFTDGGKYRRAAVELHKDGTYRLHEYRCADYHRHLNIFLAALTVWNVKRTI
jgi:hypothetical protein